MLIQNNKGSNKADVSRQCSVNLCGFLVNLTDSVCFCLQNLCRGREEWPMAGAGQFPVCSSFLLWLDRQECFVILPVNAPDRLLFMQACIFGGFKIGQVPENYAAFLISNSLNLEVPLVFCRWIEQYYLLFKSPCMFHLAVGQGNKLKFSE